ncbi:MAG: hypothetical protein PHS33_07605 [Candidatus Omnitrophica bacterium]|nr:hypothetical protein [Candidatus Omnitrophota bacterium]
MIEKAINKILELAKIEQLEINGRKYTSSGIIPVKEPLPTILTVHTLSGIADYLNKNIDTLNKEKLFIHVCNPTNVNLHAYFKDGFCERAEYLSAIFEPPEITRGNYIGIEEFIINLQAKFVPTENTAAILKVVGNVKGEQVQNFSDDGISQAVTAKVGIATLETVPVPNPIKLKPFRTFPEIDQPESLFIFRMRQQQGAVPACGLWEADNKLWKVEAIKSIAEWLQGKLPSIPIIA